MFQGPSLTKYFFIVVREMGFHNRLFDLLDERPLCCDELVQYCCLVLGHDAMDGAPDPQADWKHFRSFGGG